MHSLMLTEATAAIGIELVVHVVCFHHLAVLAKHRLQILIRSLE